MREIMPNHDQLHRYLFENYAVRGELVTVSETISEILNNRRLRRRCKAAGRARCATSLLTATLKFDGDITVQLQGDGPLKLATATVRRCALRAHPRLSPTTAPCIR